MRRGVLTSSWLYWPKKSCSAEQASAPEVPPAAVGTPQPSEEEGSHTRRADIGSAQNEHFSNQQKLHDGNLHGKHFLPHKNTHRC